MRKLNLAPYPVTLIGPEGKSVEDVYDLRRTLQVLLFLPQLGLTAERLMRHHKLWEKIEACPKDEVLLEDAEWQAVHAAVNETKGFLINDVEFVQRVLEAPVVDPNAEGCAEP